MPYLRQPRQFYTIFILELWERFGFYTVQGVLVYYFIHSLGLTDHAAFQTFGAFIALLYGLVPIGGYVGDKILGTKRTIILGLLILMLGYSSLALCHLCQNQSIYIALSLICIGNGLFKANPSTLLSICYVQNPEYNLHSGFTLYYMAINIGALLALLIGPTIAKHYGYAVTYYLSALGIFIGLTQYIIKWREIVKLPTIADNYPLNWQRICGIMLGLIICTIVSTFLLQHKNIARTLLLSLAILLSISYFILRAREQTVAAKQRMLLAFILMVEAVIFYTLYQQMPTSLNLFAIHNVTPTIVGLHINPISFQMLNPLWIIILSPILAILYAYLEKHKINFSIPYKFAFGMLFCGASFLLLYFARFMPDSTGHVTSWWLITSYFLQCFSELLISAIGIAMVAELVPQHIVGLVMGMWFLTSSIAGFTGAAVASYTALPTTIKPGIQSLMIYTHTFAWIGLITISIAIILFLYAPKLNKLTR